MAQNAQVLDRPKPGRLDKIRKLQPVSPLKPFVYPSINGKTKCNPPHDWLDDLLVALKRPPGPYTFENAEEYLNTEPVELYNGWLVKQEMSDFKGKELESGLHDHLSSAARLLGFGQVLPDQMECLLNDGDTIKPDLSLISWARRRQQVIPKGPNDRPTLMGSPEFVVEVRSPSNRRTQERVKRTRYFNNGAEIIWDIDDQKKIIYVYRVDSQTKPETYTKDDEIDCEPLLPGWSRKVSDFFEEEISVEVMFNEVHQDGKNIGREEGEKIGEQRGIEIGEQRGIEIGEQRGIEIGKQDMLLRLLQVRFVDVPEHILDTIKQAHDVAQLDSWFEKALMAQSVDELQLEDETVSNA